MLVKWAEKWQVEFNPDKCKLIHFGSTNEGRTYTIYGMILESIEDGELGLQDQRSSKVILCGR